MTPIPDDYNPCRASREMEFSKKLGPKAFLREDATHFGDMSSSDKTVGAGNPRESLDHQFKRLFVGARLPAFPLAQA